MQKYLEKNWVRQILVVCAGAVGSFAMQPFEIWPVLIISLSGFWLLLTMGQKKWHAWLSGFLFSFGYLVASLWWVGNALLVDGNPYAWALPLAVFGLPALLSFYGMIAGGLTRTFAKGRSFSSFLFFVAMVAFWEWGRGNMFTGFPWNLFGMTWTSSLPMAQLASVGGVHLLNLLTIFIMALPAFLWKGEASKQTKIILTASSLLLIAINFGWGYNRLQENPTSLNKDVVIQIVTPNIAQADKWNPDLMAKNFFKTVALMHPNASNNHKSGKARAIILPETALMPEVFTSPDAMNALKVALNAYPEKTYLLGGALKREEDPNGTTRYYNSLAGMDKTGKVRAWFNKFHLVPFGEYIPFQKYVPFGPVAKFAGFQGGKGPETWTQFDGLPPFGPLICYEVIFAGEITAPENHPSWIINVTNDAWYGVSPGPFQHLAQTQFRAIEEGIPLIRSTNTGISAVIDPAGRILNQSPLFKDYVQEEYLPNPIHQKTSFSLHKNLLFFMFLILCCFPMIKKYLSQRI